MSESDFAMLNENPSTDQVANVLKWVLLITAIVCFAVVIWGTFKTYQLAPPLPQNFVTSSGQIIMTQDDIVSGKAGFQRADLMDYGSLYGMGSYFGEDYTAKYMVRLGRLTEDEIAHQRFGKSFSELAEGDQYVVRKNMQESLHQIDLSSNRAILSDAISKSITQLQSEISQYLLRHDFETGYTKAYSLDNQSALQTADFLIYSYEATKYPGVIV